MECVLVGCCWQLVKCDNPCDGFVSVAETNYSIGQTASQTYLVSSNTIIELNVVVATQRKQCVNSLNACAHTFAQFNLGNRQIELFPLSNFQLDLMDLLFITFWMWKID